METETDTRSETKSETKKQIETDIKTESDGLHGGRQKLKLSSNRREAPRREAATEPLVPTILKKNSLFCP